MSFGRVRAALTGASPIVSTDRRSGTGYFVTGGAYVPIKWSRNDINSCFTYMLEDGTALNLSRGTTYGSRPTAAAQALAEDKIKAFCSTMCAGNRAHSVFLLQHGCLFSNIFAIIAVSHPRTKKPAALWESVSTRKRWSVWFKMICWKSFDCGGGR